MDWKKKLGLREETVEELSLRLREERVKSSIKSFYAFRKEMEENIDKYTYPGAKEQFWRRADLLMGLNVEQATDAAIDHHNKKHIHICWED